MTILTNLVKKSFFDKINDMIRVKSFTGYNGDNLEGKINSWLEKEKDIEIVEVSQSQDQDGDMVVLVFYKKVNN